MNFNEGTWWAVGLLISVAITVIGFYVKKTVNTVDEHGKRINNIEKSYVTKDELKDFKSDYNESIKKIRTDIEEIKDTTLTKADFIRIQGKTEDKIDKIYNLILERKEKNG